MPPPEKRNGKKRKVEADGDAVENVKDSHAAVSTAPTQKKPSKKEQPSSRSNFAEVHKPQKPSAIAKAGRGRNWTLSIAIPGSILLNAQSPELRTHLAGQIARTCSIFSVDEIIVFHEPNHVAAAQQQQPRQRGKYRQTTSEQGADDENDMDALLCRILEYLETPQYLRKALIPMHPSLRLAGLLPPLDMPHHLRRTDQAPFREGVTIERPQGYQPIFGQAGGTFVDVGLDEPVWVERDIQPGKRVTIRMGDQPTLVAPDTPTTESGFAWGYKVRQASCIGNIFLESPFDPGYDVTFGTSERGTDVAGVSANMTGFSHALIVFGGLAGLELTIEADPLLSLSADEAENVFDYWTNVCPNQGSRTIRTEEALMIALARLKQPFESNGI